MGSFEEQLQELKRLTNTSKNVDLARVLGKSPKTISNWKHRDHIPEDIFLQARRISQNVDSESSGMVSLTHYEVEASAGHGSLIEVEIATEILFSERYLRDELHVTPNEVFTMKAKGDSMYPTLINGSMIVVKKLQDFVGDGIYVFRVNGQLMVKRLQFLPTKIIFKSDNYQHYEPWELTHQELETIDFEILGQAVWGGGKL